MSKCFCIVWLHVRCVIFKTYRRGFAPNLPSFRIAFLLKIEQNVLSMKRLATIRSPSQLFHSDSCEPNIATFDAAFSKKKSGD
jgi:hypothetical protein